MEQIFFVGLLCGAFILHHIEGFILFKKNCNPEENERSNISSMDDIQNLFKETIAEFMENGLDAELDDKLDYNKYDCLHRQSD